MLPAITGPSRWAAPPSQHSHARGGDSAIPDTCVGSNKSAWDDLVYSFLAGILAAERQPVHRLAACQAPTQTLSRHRTRHARVDYARDRQVPDRHAAGAKYRSRVDGQPRYLAEPLRATWPAKLVAHRGRAAA
jgi:hypothetical protein